MEMLVDPMLVAWVPSWLREQYERRNPFFRACLRQALKTCNGEYVKPQEKKPRCKKDRPLPPPAPIEDLEENYTSHYKDQRYDLLVMISSKVFDTNDKKTSVWIEDPTEAHGITILAAFKKEAREMLKEKMKETIEKKNMNEQYVLRDVLISYNQTKQVCM